MSDPVEKAVEKTVEEAAKAARDFLATIGGPAATEFGGILGDWVKYWRVKNMVNITLRAKRFLDARGIEPRKVLPATMVPLLEAASLAEDETLQEKWAALLASAADPSTAEVSPAYVSVLRDLSPQEVLILDRMYRRKGSETFAGEEKDMYWILENEIVHHFGLAREQIAILATNLARLGLSTQKSISVRADADPLATDQELENDEAVRNKNFSDSFFDLTGKVQRTAYRLTPLAVDLLRRCQPHRQEPGHGAHK